jgi:hypothetical protein
MSATPKADLLAVNHLLMPDTRRVSQEDHLHLFRSISTDDLGRDDIDRAAADPLRDHLPQSAPGHKVKRVLSILDQLDRENTNRRFNT